MKDFKESRFSSEKDEELYMKQKLNEIREMSIEERKQRTSQHIAKRGLELKEDATQKELEKRERIDQSVKEQRILKEEQQRKKLEALSAQEQLESRRNQKIDELEISRKLRDFEKVNQIIQARDTLLAERQARIEMEKQKKLKDLESNEAEQIETKERYRLLEKSRMKRRLELKILEQEKDEKYVKYIIDQKNSLKIHKEQMAILRKQRAEEKWEKTKLDRQRTEEEQEKREQLELKRAEMQSLRDQLRIEMAAKNIEKQKEMDGESRKLLDKNVREQQEKIRAKRVREFEVRSLLERKNKELAIKRDQSIAEFERIQVQEILDKKKSMVEKEREDAQRLEFERQQILAARTQHLESMQDRWNELEYCKFRQQYVEDIRTRHTLVRQQNRMESEKERVMVTKAQDALNSKLRDEERHQLLQQRAQKGEAQQALIKEQNRHLDELEERRQKKILEKEGERRERIVTLKKEMQGKQILMV